MRVGDHEDSSLRLFVEAVRVSSVRNGAYDIHHSRVEDTPHDADH